MHKTLTRFCQLTQMNQQKAGKLPITEAPCSQNRLSGQSWKAGAGAGAGAGAEAYRCQLSTAIAGDASCGRPKF